MGSNQSAGIYVHGDQVTESPTRGGKVPVHGGLKPVHGKPNNSPNFGPELLPRPYAPALTGGWTSDAYSISANNQGGGNATWAGVVGANAHNYLISFDIIGIAGNGMTINFAGTNVGQITADGHYEFPSVTGGGGALQVIPWSGAPGNFVVTNLSVRENFG